MGYRIAADLLVVFHASFVVFVVVGGALVLRWRRLVWLHLPAAVWGVLVVLTGWGCPLTPLENGLRRAGGEAGYEGGFIAHYLLPLLYPVGLTRGAGVVLAAIAVLANVVIYTRVVVRAQRRRTPFGAGKAGVD